MSLPIQFQYEGMKLSAFLHFQSTISSLPDTRDCKLVAAVMLYKQRLFGAELCNLFNSDKM